MGHDAHTARSLHPHPRRPYPPPPPRRLRTVVLPQRDPRMDHLQLALRHPPTHSILCSHASNNSIPPIFSLFFFFSFFFLFFFLHSRYPPFPPFYCTRQRASVCDRTNRERSLLNSITTLLSRRFSFSIFSPFCFIHSLCVLVRHYMDALLDLECDVM